MPWLSGEGLFGRKGHGQGFKNHEVGFLYVSKRRRTFQTKELNRGGGKQVY